MKKIVISVITVFILFLLQTSIFHHLSLNGIVPNLMLIVVCSYGFLRDESDGVLAGFFCGILIDAMYGDYIGFSSLLLMYIGFFNGMLNRLYIDDKIRLPIICIGISDLIYSLVYYCLRFLLNGHFNFIFYLVNIILPEILYTVVISIILFPLIMFIDKRIVYSTIAEDKNAL